MTNILVLEDNELRNATFAKRLARHDVTFTETAADCIAKLEEQQWGVVFLDHDLGGDYFSSTEDTNTGSEVVRWMVEHSELFDSTIVIVHSMNGPAGESMHAKLREAGIYTEHLLFSILVTTYFKRQNFL